MKKLVRLTALLVSAAFLVFTGCKNAAGSYEEFTFSGLTADGSASATTTTLTLNFGEEVPDFAVEDITILANGTGTSKGTLTPDTAGAGVYKLTVSGISASGEITVALAKSGSIFLPGLKTVNVFFKAGSLVNWQQVANSPFTAEVRSIAYGNGKFIAADTTGVSISSDNGVTWSAVDTSVKGIKDAKIRFLNDEFWVCGPTGQLAHSDDGAIWTTVVQSVITGTVFDIAYKAAVTGSSPAPQKYIAVGAGNKIIVSNDKTTWTEVTHAITGLGTAGFLSIIYGNDKFVVTSQYVASGQGGGAAYSADGSVWNDLTSVTKPMFTGHGNGSIPMLAYGNGVYIMVGNGQVARSTNGIYWTLIDLSAQLGSGSTGWLNQIIYADGKFVAVGGGGGYLFHSTDGIIWTKEVQPAGIFTGSTYINAVAFGDGRFVVVGGDPFIAYTTD